MTDHARRGKPPRAPWPPRLDAVTQRPLTAGLILQQHMDGLAGMAFVRWVCRNHPATVTRRGSLWRCEMLGMVATSPTSAEAAILRWCETATARAAT